ncbi:hypothetical protein ASPZODRAFT_165577 [Penicilliopsis zonata CBS 506.65]|uniref:Fungal-type protein kinase domain-containing protein n=1 Tax=Penicilliopsis zonata CBS 506.65 TaxID=1073090 RepID=A0A1L9SNJ2_9EURO|nr:hypothetical protein ASPZODRAFT_165577 [Penicilliopsis zonata CBS 506.65]OJJ48760.1 hypothetical protein ASPZODRAFT_165577 [Penicilliopsis zonata CBS 506.65]
MDPITDEDRHKIWARLPDLNIGHRYLTTVSRQAKNLIHLSQVRAWPNFCNDVRRYTSRSDVLGQFPPVGGVQVAYRRESYPVGNEAGVTGRWVSNIAMNVNAVAEKLLLPKFADYQLGNNGPRGCSVDDSPGIILLKGGSRTVLVGEFKTPWTTDLSVRTTNDEKIARLWGQITNYMDSCRCRYAIMSTYMQTVCIRRTGDYSFEVSPVIHHNIQSLPVISSQSPTISVREALLYMAYLAGDGEGDSAFSKVVGNLYRPVLAPKQGLFDHIS